MAFTGFYSELLNSDHEKSPYSFQLSKVSLIENSQNRVMSQKAKQKERKEKKKRAKFENYQRETIAAEQIQALTEIYDKQCSAQLRYQARAALTRVPNRVLQSRHPGQNFPSIP